jgi:alkylhydroperoxidase family enzyme
LHAERVTRGASAIRDSSLTELRKIFDEGQLVELTLVICAANFTNRFNDALRAVPDLGG